MGRGWTALVGVGVLALAATTIADPLAFMADDSWFYLVIGNNVAHGRGVTFSGVIPTNGFQPLWQGVVAATLAGGRIVGVHGAASQARLVLVIGWVILAVGLWRFQRLLASLAVGSAGQGGALVVVLAYLGGFTGTAGSEANLVFLTLVLALHCLVRLLTAPSSSAGDAVRCGLLVGLVVLARLDAGFTALAAVVALATFAPGTRPERLRLGAMVGLGAAVVVGPYLLWNRVRFGHLLPIAGAIKLDRRRLWFAPSAIGIYGWVLLTMATVLGIVAFLMRSRRHTDLLAWTIPFAGGVVSTAVYFAWSPGKLTDLAWYHVPLLVAVAVSLAIVVARLVAWRPQPIGTGAAVGAVLILVVLVGGQVAWRIDGANHRFWHPVARVSQEVGALVPPDAVVATVDYPGVLAAYSGRRVLALDGLTGDYRLQDKLRDDGAGCTLGDLGVGWVLVDSADRLIPSPSGRGNTIEVASWLHHVSAGRLYLAPVDLVLDDAETGLSLWRVHPRCRRTGN